MLPLGIHVGPGTNSDPQPCSQVSGTSHENLLRCGQCSHPRYFRGNRGLKIHIGKVHKPVSVLINQTSSANSGILNSTTNSNTSEQPFWQRICFLKNNVPVLKRIPRGARFCVASALCLSIDKILSQNSQSAWEELLTFSYRVLHVPNRQQNEISLTQKIKNNCSHPELASIPIYSKSQFINQANPIRKIENKANDGDFKGAAQLLFSSDVVAADTPETLCALRSKHPPPLPNIIFPDPPSSDQTSLNCTSKDLLNVILSFKPGSAGGLDGFTPQHYKDLVCGAAGDAGTKLLSRLTSLINFMLAGKVPSPITEIIYGANLCALSKKDGGIRPIAVGNTIRRMASKICCRHILPIATDLFQPIQLGFGSKGGCEAAVHAARTFLLNNGGDVLLKVDIKNAFNSVDRAAMLTQIRDICPDIYSYLWQCYGHPTKLFYKTQPIISGVGCQQGDPLGPAIFSLAIQPIISKLQSKFNVWYLDDGTLGGDATSVIRDLKSLTEKFKKIGLDFNCSKCEILVSDSVPESEKSKIIQDFNDLAPNIKLISRDSLLLLGAPVLDESIPGFFEQKIQNFNESSHRLYDINAHYAFFIVRLCLFVPKFTYLLRCTHLFKFDQLLETLDNMIKISLSKILNCCLDDNKVWSQATLPVRYGGLGVRKISSVSLPAFLSSVYSVSDLVRSVLEPTIGSVEVSYLSDARNAWQVACPGTNIPTLSHSQREWDKPLCEKTWQILFSDFSTDSDRARLLAVSQSESGHWLQAIPSSNIGTLLDRITLSLCICLRLGSRSNHPHRCRCGDLVNELGHHGLSCSQSAGRISRHVALNDIIRRALVVAGVPSVLEPVGISRGDGKRPDGMTLIPWSVGKPLVWDATCVDTLAPSHLPVTCKAAGAAAKGAENSKFKKYACIGPNYQFMPFAVETMGPWGSEARRFANILCKKLIEASGDRRAGSFFRQRISLAIQRGNAASLLGTLPIGSSGSLEDVFYVL